MGINRLLDLKANGCLTALFALCAIVSLSNCNQQKFETGDDGSGRVLNLGNTDDDATGVLTQTGGPNCRDELHSITTPVKTVMIVDISGSNVGQDGTPATDPKRIVRGDSIERYFNTYKAKANFGWSFSTFAGGNATTLLAMGNAAQMANAITTFRATQDEGNTPYVAALNAARDVIKNDTGRAPNTKYIVVFISDGKPNPDVADITLKSKVHEVTGALAGAVSFNTIYYGGTNAEASERLKMMAVEGGGNFLNTNANGTGTNFLITDLVIIPGVNCN